ncbi:MAG: hypothetical protein ACRC6N_11020 [Plesiomonas sp.]|uniref:hypothetical protein n=1 Tax=Plesiomonas sp. TaxID=2486279 RepID=UPI003F398A4A
MDKQNVLARIKELKLTPTGEKEISGFRCIDVAFANQIAHALHGLCINHADGHNEAFIDFIARQPKDQVLLGKFDDIKEFVRAVRQSKAGRVSQAANPLANRDALPLINVSRSFDCIWTPTDRQIRRYRYGDVVQDDVVISVLDAHPVQLNYKILVLSAEKESLSLICNAIGSHFVSMLSTSFFAPTTISMADIDIECSFNELGGIGFNDESVPIFEDRIYAASATISVIADVITAHAVTQSVERTVVEADIING